MNDKNVRSLLTIRPDPGNRNSEGSIIRLNDGRLFLAYSHFYGGHADNSPAYIAGRYSDDMGETWTDDVEVIPNEGKENVMSVCFLRLLSGKLALFYVIKNSLSDCKLHMRISENEGKTFGERVCAITEDGYFVINNDRVVQLSSGRLIVPASLHPVIEGKWSSRGIARCFISDDEGRTWRRSESVLEPPAQGKSGLQEPGVVQIKDGSLLMWIRTDLGCQFTSHSLDEGETWSDAIPSDIKSPCSPASIKRIPDTGDLVIVWNDHSGKHPYRKGLRTPLCGAISKDEGKTWGNSRVLEDNPYGWYCYTSITFVDDRVILSYCAGDTREMGGLDLLQVTSVAVNWLF